MKLFRLCAAALLFCAGSTASFAQDDEGPQTQGEDAVYVSVTFLDFKPGMRTKAFDIINEYFKPASVKAGTPEPEAVHFQTGKWDAGFLWTLEGGMADLEWFISPNNIKWRAALEEIAGGSDEADAVQADFSSMIASSVTEVGHMHTGETSD